MRVLFLLILLAGIAVGALYPWAARNFSGHEIGTWRAADRSGFRPISVNLTAADAPLQVLVDLTAGAGTLQAFDRTVLSISATRDGATVLHQALSFSANPSPRQQSPQSGDSVFRDSAGPIRTLVDGIHVFTLGPLDVSGISIKAVDLVLRGNVMLVDERAAPLGLGLSAIGIAGFALTFVRGRRPGNPNSQPSPPRWGRGGASGL